MAGIELDDTARALLDDLFDKWSLLVLDKLCHGPLRFAQLRREIPTITPKSLTSTVRRLERNGIVEREVLCTRPVAVRYRITASGRSLQAPLEQILRWVVAHSSAAPDPSAAPHHQG